MRHRADYGKCRSEIFGTPPPPAHTLLNIVQLARPGMMVEVDVTAMVPVKSAIFLFPPRLRGG